MMRFARFSLIGVAGLVGSLLSISSASAVWYDSATGEAVKEFPNGFQFADAGSHANDPISGGVEQPDHSMMAMNWDEKCSTWRDGSGREVFFEPYGVERGQGRDVTVSRGRDDHARLHWKPCDPKAEVVTSTTYQLPYVHMELTDYSNPPPEMPWQPYVKIVGGPALPGTVMFTTPDNLNAGPAFGAAIGLNTSVPGVSVEVDALHTQRAFAEFPGDYISTTSLMGTAIYTTPVTDKVAIFGGVGVGGIFVSEDYTNGGTGSGLGYQALIGGSVGLSDTLSAIAQVQFQDTFAPIHASNGFDVQTADTSFVIGAKVDLPVKW